MAVGPPNQQVWLWLTKGFTGLFTMIDNWLAAGVPPTSDLKTELVAIRARLDELIKKLP